MSDNMNTNDLIVSATTASDVVQTGQAVQVMHHDVSIASNPGFG